MKTWIDQDLCTGDGICSEICPDIYFGHDDGLFYVKEVNDPTGLGSDGEPKLKMAAGLAEVPDHLLNDAIDAAEACPGVCIFFSDE